MAELLELSHKHTGNKKECLVWLLQAFTTHAVPALKHPTAPNSASHGPSAPLLSPYCSRRSQITQTTKNGLERVCFKWMAMCQASCSAMCSLHWELREVRLLCFQPDPVSSSLSVPTVPASRHSRWAQLPWSGHSVSTVRSGRKPLTLSSLLLERPTLV